MQCGPVKNVVLKIDAEFAFIEFEHKVSVGFALALMEGVQLYGQKIYLQPKIEDPVSNPRSYHILSNFQESRFFMIRSIILLHFPHFRLILFT